MRTSLIRAIVGVVVLGVVAFGPAFHPLVRPAHAQLAQVAPAYGPAELEQLLAPVALYPDDLLATVLMAATYPLEVIEAYRWVQDRYNASLRGDQLAAAIADKDWDPSVKSLVPFPQILQMMNDRLDWMQRLGDAFLAQEADVMDSVQRLRARAQAAGRLQSTPEQTVYADGPTIVIRPANPRYVYVPVYDPMVVYGGWLYPDYPPYYFPPPIPFFGPALITGIYFGVAVGIIDSLWGWHDWDWRRHRIHIDRDRFNFIRPRRPPFRGDFWEHDSYHRRGVFYRDRDTRQRFQPPGIGTPDARRSYRGYDQGDRLPGVQPRREIPRREDVRPGQPPSPPGVGPGERRVTPRDRRSDERQRFQAPGQQPSLVPSQPQPTFRPPAVVRPQDGSTSRRPPSAFQGIERGSDVRSYEQRGRSSRETFTAPTLRRDAGQRFSPPSGERSAPRGDFGRSAPQQRSGSAPPGGREQRRR